MKYSVILVSLLYLHLCGVCISGFEIRSRVKSVSTSDLELNVAAPNGKEYNLKLSKAENGILHHNFKYFTVHSDEESGRPVFDVWTPSQSELKSAEDLHVDQENRAVIRASKDHKGQRVLEGMIDGMKFVEVNGVPILTEPEKGHRDYIDTNVNLTYINPHVHQSSDYVVEVAIVCDKEWGDLLQHDRQKILNLWTVHYWDINMRFRTLPSSNISFRITSITVISNKNQQPFIEEARNDEGKTNLGSILDKFSWWMWNQTSVFPKFDMAVCVTFAQTQWKGGIAYLNGACRRTGAIVCHADISYNNDIMTHEIAHNLGAPHDDDSNYPGGCSSVSGFIMSGNSDRNRYFFSECSDRTIKSYVSSDQAACLRRIDEPSGPVIPPDFSSVQAPTMNEQCKAWMRNPNATVPERDTGNCTRVICWNGPIGYYMRPVDNSPCLYGQCFRGRCIPSDMSVLQNVGSGQCVLSTDRFSNNDNAKMSNCPNVPTPLEKYHSMRGQLGWWLMMPYSTQEATEHEDKCLQSSSQEGGQVKFYRCSGNISRYEWQFEDAGNNEYLIKEATTKRCMKQDGNTVKSVSSCNRNDPSMLWRFTMTKES